MSGSDPTPGSEAPRRNGFLTFWTTLPGILTGSAAVITAIVGLITLLNGFGAGQDNNGTNQMAPGQISSTSGPTNPSSSPSNGVLIQRSRFTMKSPDDADLETGIVGSGLSSVDLYLYCSGTQCLLNAMRSLMTTIDGPGAKSTCIGALSSRHDQALELGHLRTGETLCIQTEEGHVGALRILGLPGAGTTEFTFSYTLWN